MALDLFQWLNEISFNKRDWKEFTDEDQKSFNIYMIHKFLSMDPDYCVIVNDIQKYTTLSSEEVYNIYKNILPKQRKFFKYIKSKNTKDDELIKQVAIFLECSTRESKEYIGMMSDQQLENLLSLYGYNKELAPRKNKKRKGKGN